MGQFKPNTCHSDNIQTPGAFSTEGSRRETILVFVV